MTATLRNIPSVLGLAAAFVEGANPVLVLALPYKTLRETRT